jgi:hypothetical protein
MTYQDDGTNDARQSVPVADPGPRVASVVLAGVSLSLLGGLLALILSTRNSLGKLFVDFNVELPQIANVAASPWFARVVGALLVLTALKEFVVRSRAARAVCNATAIFAAVLLGGVYAIGMFLPLIKLVQNLSR